MCLAAAKTFFRSPRRLCSPLRSTGTASFQRDFSAPHDYKGRCPVIARFIRLESIAFNHHACSLLRNSVPSHLGGISLARHCVLDFALCPHWLLHRRNTRLGNARVSNDHWRLRPFPNCSLLSNRRVDVCQRFAWTRWWRILLEKGRDSVREPSDVDQRSLGIAFRVRTGRRTSTISVAGLDFVASSIRNAGSITVVAELARVWFSLGISKVWRLRLRLSSPVIVPAFLSCFDTHSSGPGQLKIRVGFVSRFGASHGCDVKTVASAKTAHPKNYSVSDH